jgi:hypothetical protein
MPFSNSHCGIRWKARETIVAEAGAGSCTQELDLSTSDCCQVPSFDHLICA